MTERYGVGQKLQTRLLKRMGFNNLTSFEKMNTLVSILYKRSFL